MERQPRSTHGLSSYFDVVQVISLERRADRLAAFFEQIDSIAWPFARPEVFKAVDGARVPAPHGWDSGGGTWGCLQSHRQVLERAIMTNARAILVLEDDALFKPDFAEVITRFLNAVPPDWEGLMLGGQVFESRPVQAATEVPIIEIEAADVRTALAQWGAAVRAMAIYQTEK